jgi:hypothetical protein
MRPSTFVFLAALIAVLYCWAAAELLKTDASPEHVGKRIERMNRR